MWLPPVTKKYEIVTITYMNMAEGFFNHDGRFTRRFGTSRTLKGTPYNDSIFKACVKSLYCLCCVRIGTINTKMLILKSNFKFFH